MAQRSIRARATAIEGFAALLRDLRDAAGKPSFREMSGRSRAISHTTLHEAAQGNRLPSWATTVEFVKACGADPADYRQRWEQADRAVRSATEPESVAPATASCQRCDLTAPADDGSSADASDSQAWTDSATAPEPPPGPSGAALAGRRRYLLPVLAAIVVLAAVGVTLGVRAWTGKDGKGKPPSSGVQLSAADCPVAQPDPPFLPPAARGDKGVFITDVTLPDCSKINRGATVTKVWRFQNVGRVAWVGYTLHRMDLPQQRNQCQTITDIPIRPTKPGEQVDIQTQITAPDGPAFCFVRFKMENAAGQIAFPASRPVYFQLIVG